METNAVRRRRGGGVPPGPGAAAGRGARRGRPPGAAGAPCAGSARLRPREPLWPARLEQAARDVALALAAAGLPRGPREREHPSRGRAARTPSSRSPRARASAWDRRRVEGPPAVDEPRSSPTSGRTWASRSGASRPRPPPQQMRDGPRSASGYWRAAVTAARSLRSRRRRAWGWSSRSTPGPLRGRWRCAGSARRACAAASGTCSRRAALKSDALEEASDRLEEDARRQGHRLAHVTRHEEQRGPRLVLVYDVEAGPARHRRLRARGGRGDGGLEAALKTRPPSRSSTRRWRRMRAR